MRKYYLDKGDGGLDFCRGRGGGEKWLDFGYNGRVELIGLFDRLDMGCEEKEVKVFDLRIEKMELFFDRDGKDCR